MGTIDRMFGQREISEEKEVGEGVERGRRRTRAKFGAVLGSLAFALVVGSVTLVPASRAAFPGANGQIAFNSERPGDGYEEIYTMNPDGTNQTKCTTDLSPDIVPAYSADGTKIAFSISAVGPSASAGNLLGNTAILGPAKACVGA